jgi:cyclophilin family peptidyl-prolyl cis-trans isomerase
MFKRFVIALLIFSFGNIAFAQSDSLISKKDRKKDVLISTDMGDIIIRLSDSTPLHRDNFLKLVKTGYYDGILFHRVMKNFMIQAGDPDSRNAKPGVGLGNGGPSYRIPAEFRTTLFHKKGVIAAARNDNPQKASSGSQFYLTQGKIFTDAALDSLQIYRLKRVIPTPHREVYKTIGGTPHLDQDYTVFGEVVKGIEVIDRIAVVPTSKEKQDLNRPLQDVMIKKAKLIKRKKKYKV